MSRAGAELILSARSGDRLRDLPRELPGRSRVVTMDISDRDSVHEAWEEVGEIDGMSSSRRLLAAIGQGFGTPK